MKTAISVPDETFARAERIAQRHGMNRSQFYAAAAARYADELESADVTAAIDAVLEGATGQADLDESTRFALDAGHRTLQVSDEQW